MFTKEDLRDYCSQILEMERRMEIIYRCLADNLSHADYKNAFEKLAREEVQHSQKVTDLLDLLMAEPRTSDND